MSSRVVLVAVSDFGERLVPLAAESAVWIADTPANRSAVERLRADGAGGGVTTFRADPAGTPDAWATGVLRAVVEHHATRSAASPLDTLELHGVVVTDALRAELAAHGFTDVVGDGEVTIARVPPAA